MVDNHYFHLEVSKHQIIFPDLTNLVAQPTLQVMSKLCTQLFWISLMNKLLIITVIARNDQFFNGCYFCYRILYSEYLLKEYIQLFLSS